VRLHKLIIDVSLPIRPSVSGGGLLTAMISFDTLSGRVQEKRERVTSKRVAADFFPRALTDSIAPVRSKGVAEEPKNEKCWCDVRIFF
jgi:hypothetical protein